MNKKINDIEIKESMDNILKKLDIDNLSAREIATKIEKIEAYIRLYMYIYLKENKKIELAIKLKIANNILSQKIINEFKESVNVGTHKKYLSNMSYNDKLFLESDMGLIILNSEGSSKLTDEKQKYYNIIEESIKEDLLKKANTDGFSNIESWQHNKRMKLENE